MIIASAVSRTNRNKNTLFYEIIIQYISNHFVSVLHECIKLYRYYIELQIICPGIFNQKLILIKEKPSLFILLSIISFSCQYWT